MDTTKTSKRMLANAFFEIRKWRVVEPTQQSIIQNEVKLWKREIPVRSVISDSDSKSEISQLTNSCASVSAVSSSSRSVSSCEEGEITEDKTTKIPKQPVVDIKNDPELRKYITAIKAHIGNLKRLSQIISTTDAIPDLCAKGLDVILACHRNVTLLTNSSASFLFTDIKIDKTPIMECFSELYAKLTSMQAFILRLDHLTSLQLLSLWGPYCIDMLFMMLPFLVSQFNDEKDQDALAWSFQTVVHTTILKCCSFIDDYEDEVKLMAIQTLSSIMQILLPINLVLQTESKEKPTSDSKLQVLYSLLMHEIYGITTTEDIKETFKPEVSPAKDVDSLPPFIPGYVLSHTLGKCNDDVETSMVKNTRPQEIVRNVACRIGTVAAYSGCTKRVFPTGYVHASHYTLEDVTKVMIENKWTPRVVHNGDPKPEDGDSRLWNKSKYWLLAMLEDGNVAIRNKALQIIRHLIVTVKFTEKDRQHLLALVTDCITDAATFDSAMGVIVAVSHIHPLKDGAVKRLCSLTLKGCDISTRVAMIDFLGKCHYTTKGINMLMSILQTLSDYWVDDGNNQNASWSRSSITCAESEAIFCTREWPMILKTLVKLSESNNAKPSNTTNNVPISTCNIYGSKWILAIWKYLQRDETSQIVPLYRTECALRFPKIVPFYSLPTEIDLMVDALKTLTLFVTFDKGGANQDIFCGEKMFMYMHKYRSRQTLSTISKCISSTQVPVSLDQKRLNKKCPCVDCSMDKLIMSSKRKEAMAIEDEYACKFQKKGDISNEDSSIPPEIRLRMSINPRSKVAHNLRPLKSIHSAIDDIHCIKFPSHLGVMVPCPKKRTSEEFTGGSILHVMNKRPTLYPTPLKIVAKPITHPNNARCNDAEPIMFQNQSTVNTVWIHCKRVAK
ncbi:hypothetical protein BBOV_II004870 [Babesia bovis T2Bo]|uniref:Uncharacterized protein n=1 Tax=Babesia bovis TaxID=5865 RepID=A7AU31_BABBO|nr:hypothetical protein BBOV_II004870 [Babesia bovis T2Bo]EDO06442.1 hypothetical protein BBOV_II004870 [Babesia bovis T2Bo]|eukprot:XP_001610010.1 hypothetical protein [Babesia bovis T2Bo]